MKASLRTLLAGIVDYAGTFPPARLSLEETVRRYIEYRQGEHAWMLGKLVWPAMKLGELPSLLKSQHVAGDAPVSVSAAFSAGPDVEEFATRFDDFAHLLTDLRQRQPCDVVVEAVELTLPAGAFAHGNGEARAIIQNTTSIVAQHGIFDISLFYEVPASQEWQQYAGFVFAELAVRQRLQDNRQRRFGFKLRTGGLEAAAFPSVERVAWVIATCRERGVPWKATAGLHHPLRSIDPDLGAIRHGFINVASAAAIDAEHHLDVARIGASRPGVDESLASTLDAVTASMVLREFSADAFLFRDDALRLGDWEVTKQKIDESRRNRFLSFGSCSFEEPIEDLQSLGLL